MRRLVLTETEAKCLTEILRKILEGGFFYRSKALIAAADAIKAKLAKEQEAQR